MATGISFDCVVCLESKTEQQPHSVARDQVLCLECVTEHIIPLFRKALDFEFHYPPGWGDTKLDIYTFKDVLDSDFIAHYCVREHEYTTDLQDRLYCKHDIFRLEEDEGVAINAQDVVMTDIMKMQKCNTFLGSKTVFAMTSVFERATDYTYCSCCCGMSCCVCGEALTDIESHTCKAKSGDEVDIALSGLTRGVDYQVCPNTKCRMVAELKEACNGMHCSQASCGQCFCFICGIAIPNYEGSTHWTIGGCPRWGPKASATLEDFDRPEIYRDVPTEIYEEAYENAMLDEQAYPTQNVPPHLPPNLDRNIGILMQRLDIIEILQELRADLNHDMSMFIGRYDTIILLDNVEQMMYLVVHATHSPAEIWAYLCAEFARLRTIVDQKLLSVPNEFWDENPDVNPILLQVLRVVQRVKEEMHEASIRRNIG